MKVAYAAQVLSESALKSLYDARWEGTKETFLDCDSTFSFANTVNELFHFWQSYSDFGKQLFSRKLMGTQVKIFLVNVYILVYRYIYLFIHILFDSV